MHPFYEIVDLSQCIFYIFILIYMNIIFTNFPFSEYFAKERQAKWQEKTTGESN